MISPESQQALVELTEKPEARDKRREEVIQLVKEINEFLTEINSHFSLETYQSKKDPRSYNALRVNNTKGSSYLFENFINLDKSIKDIEKKIVVFLQENL